MAKNILPVLILVLLISACSQSVEPTPTLALTVTEVPAATPTFTPTNTPTITSSPTPTPEPEITFPPDFPCFVVFSQFTNTGMDVFLGECNSDEIQAVRVTELDGFAMFPRISPDKLKVVYTYYDPLKDTEDYWAFEMFDMVDPDYVPYALTSGNNAGGSLSWSYDSQYIVYYASQPDGAEMDIYRIDVETGTRLNLTADSPVWDAHPHCSPVEDQIVFVSDRADGGKLLDNLWLMDLDGNNLRQLTNTETWEDTFPSWSPDGTQIAFFRWGIMGDEAEGQPGLVVLDLETCQETVLDENASLTNDSAAVWSPDGKYLAYQDSSLGEKSNILVVPVDGGDPVQITDLDGDIYDISWSRDSELIIFTHASDTELAVYIVTKDGFGLRPLFPGDGNAFGMWFPGDVAGGD
jgi:Tol biopolymer transport system component